MKRIPCPYHWCSQTVTLRPAPRWPGTHHPDSQLIPAHQIVHPVLPGTCPASNMHYPLSEEAAQHLRDQEAVDNRRIPPLVTGGPHERRFLRVAPDPDGSRSLRQPGRLGREPGPRSEDWALGGREDEDSGKTKPPISPPRPPAGVAGQEVGRHVASVEELIGMTRNIQLIGSEAVSALQESRDSADIALGKVEQALTELSALQGAATSETLNEYRAILSQAATDIRSLMEQAEEICNAMTGGSEEKGEAFIANLLA